MVAFGRTAEIVRDYVRKGTKIYVEGRINNRQYEKDGQKHYRSEIVVNELVLLDGGGKREEPQNNEVEVNDSDLPF
jgi:single-strand DNA-binding protein